MSARVRRGECEVNVTKGRSPRVKSNLFAKKEIDENNGGREGKKT